VIDAASFQTGDAPRRTPRDRYPGTAAVAGPGNLRRPPQSPTPGLAAGQPVRPATGLRPGLPRGYRIVPIDNLAKGADHLARSGTPGYSHNEACFPRQRCPKALMHRPEAWASDVSVLNSVTLCP